jgi:hypothetical protein
MNFSHVVVDTPPREDDLRMVAEHLGLVGQVIGIDADAVATISPGRNGRKFHLVPAALEHIQRIDPNTIKDDRQAR